MDFLALIQLIMMIISAIMEMIGGTSFSHTLVPDQNRSVQLAAHDWSCGDTYWQSAPSVKDGAFSGTVALDCEVYGSDGGGLIEARQHLIGQLPQQVSAVNAGPHVRNYEGLPSNAYDVSIQVQASDELARLEGRTDIATDGFTRLRSVFTSTRTPSEGNSRYLRHVVDELDIQPAEREGWFKVTMRYTSRIDKPWGVSSKTFLQKVTEKQEEKMLNRREQVLNDLAAHL